MSARLTKSALLSELEAARVELDRLRTENKALKAAQPQPTTTRRPVRVMSLDRAWAFKARAQLARDGSTVACQPVKIAGDRTAWAVF